MHGYLSPRFAAAMATMALAIGSPIANAQTPPAATKQRFQQVAPGVFAGLPSPGSDVSANSGFIVGKDAVWVFEALRPEIVKEMLPEIRKHSAAPVKYVVNSHHHYELVMGNAEFSGATIVAHENVRQNLLRTPPAAQIARTRESNKRLGLPDSSEGETPPVRLPDLTVLGPAGVS